RDAFGKAPTGIVLIDKEGNLFQGNTTMREITGFQDARLMDLNVEQLLHIDDIDAYTGEYSRLVAGDIRELKQELRLITASNQVIWVELYASPVYDEHGLFMFAITHIINITQRVLASDRFQRVNRALHVLNDANHGFTNINNESDLLQYICEVIISTGEYRMAWVGYCQDDKHKLVKPMAHAGHEQGYLKNLITWADEPRGHGPTGTCIRSRQPQIVRNVEKESTFAPWREPALARGYKSCAAFPIIISDKPIGALMLYASEMAVFDIEEVSLLQDLTANLANGIQNIRVRTEHERAQHELRASEEKFRLAFNHASMGMGLVNPEGIILEVNDTSLEMLSYTREELVGKSLLEITYPDDRDKSLDHFRKLFTGELEDYQIEKRYIRKDGHIIYAILNGSIIKDTRGYPAYMVTMVQDITLRREAEQALRESEERFRNLYDDTPSMFFTVDSGGLIKSVNQYGARELGYGVDDLINMPVDKLVHPDDSKFVKNHFAECVLNADHINRIEFRKVKKNGNIIWVRETIRRISDEELDCKFLIVCEDISELKRLSSQLSWQASHDALTGLVNRVEFERRLERVLRTIKLGTEEHALCFLDMDQFKIINDTCGHLAGDELLRQLSEVLSVAVRKRDTIARLGGDEFGILMEHCSLEKARNVADSILKKIEDFRFTWESKRFSLGVSIGLVPISGVTDTVTSIMREADAACYAAKDAGRNQVHVYTAGDKSLSRIRGEMQWVSIINEAIEESNLLLYRQDIEALYETDIRGKHYEILLRLRASDGHIILPGAFMPAAERYNLTHRIDSWVINTYLSWLHDNPAELKQLDQCTINISGLSISNTQLTDQVLELFERYEIPGEKICFEITETAAIQNMSNAIKFMQILKGIGCSFALDDFGSGVSSFAYLKQIPVDYIKIDGSFIRDILIDQVDFEMVRSINDIARVMGIRTIAEFVESDEIKQL
ncbi:MAG: PAS domain S-box protein, partial [Thiotrichales bacterium]|nr:PAS domain S-box protein [Thiotrichales bacterium]